MHTKAFYAVLLMALSVAGASAQTTLVMGEGQVSCGTYLQDRRNAKTTQDYVYATWVRGFLSGFNFATQGKQVSGGTEPATILAYLDKYCRDNPLHFLAGGAFSLVKDLGGTQ